MNKKLLLGTALMLGLTPILSSCIDDTESASVTNIRNAKAEMLKSMAELNSANAQAALILANAQKAVSEADAAYKQAQADYQKALAAYQEAQTDAMKQKLAIEIEQLRVNLEQAKANLQRTLAQLDADVARYKYEALNYQQQYDKLLAQVDKDKATEIRNLLDTYQQASETLIGAKRNLAAQTAQLAKLEAGLISLPESVNNEITLLQEENASKQVEIDGQKALIATYEKYAGSEVTPEEIQAAHIKYIDAEEAYKAADAQREADNAAINPAYTKLSDYYSQSVMEWTNGWNDLSYSEYNETTERWDSYYVSVYQVYSTYAPASARGKYCVVIDEQRNHQITYLPLFESVTYENKTLEYTTSEGLQTQDYSIYKTYYNLIDDGSALETIIAHKEKQLNLWSSSNPDLLEALKKQLPDLQKAQSDAQKAFDDAVKAYTDAQAAQAAAEKVANDTQDAANKAWEAYSNNTDTSKAEELLKAANSAQTAADKAWNDYNTANSATSTAYDTKRNALNTLDSATSELNRAVMQINDQEAAAESLAAQISELKDKVASLIEAGKANEDNITAYNNTFESAFSSWGAYMEAADAMNVAWNEYWPIENGGIIGGNAAANQKISEANQKIDELTQDITANETTIETLKERLADIEAGTDSEAELLQEQIDTIKDEIEKYSIAVEVAQKKYDMAKSELEAAVGSDSAE